MFLIGKYPNSHDYDSTPHLLGDMGGIFNWEILSTRVRIHRGDICRSVPCGHSFRNIPTENHL